MSEGYKRTIFTIASILVLFIYAFCIFINASPVKIYLDKKSDFEFVSDQASYALRTMDDAEYEKLKDKRASLQRSMSNYETRLHLSMLYSSFLLLATSFPYAILYIACKPPKKKAFRRAEDFPYREWDKYEDQRPGVQ